VWLSACFYEEVMSRRLSCIHARHQAGSRRCPCSGGGGADSMMPMDAKLRYLGLGASNLVWMEWGEQLDPSWSEKLDAQGAQLRWPRGLGTLC
jgi:hypothetical protein